MLNGVAPMSLPWRMSSRDLAITANGFFLSFFNLELLDVWMKELNMNMSKHYFMVAKAQLVKQWTNNLKF